MGYLSYIIGFLTRARESGQGTMLDGQFDWGGRLQKSNGGARRSPQNDWKPFKKSAKAKGGLTARATTRAGTKVGLSDPVVPYGRAIAQRIKATLGITGLSPPRVHIDGEVWHLDVGSSHPGAELGPKGLAVRIKAARELGSERRETVRSLSVAGVGNLRGSAPSTRGPEWTYRWCTSCSAKSIAG